MKQLLLLLMLAGALVARGQQQKPLTESEKEKLRVYWRKHWSEKVKVQVIKVDDKNGVVQITNDLPYPISRYHLNLQWYDAGGKLIRTPINNLESYMKANSIVQLGIPKVKNAASLKATMGFIEMNKIGMKQDTL